MVALFVSCDKDDDIDFLAENEKEITDYIEKHKLNAQKSESGLYYVIDEPGTGIQASPSSYVNVVYNGYFTNGTVFDESDTDGVYFNPQDVIKGWTEGISYFKEGGSGKLLVPSHLAFGKSSSKNIPSGSVLIYDIKLIKVYHDVESCMKDKNEKEIINYLAEHKLEAQKTESGLYYSIEEGYEGTGVQPTASSTVTVAYKGYFINGSGFDQSKDDGISFSLNKVIKGWTEGIPYFKEGGKGKLLIPSHLAYGPYYYNGIPGGSVLIFDVELISVEQN